MRNSAGPFGNACSPSAQRGKAARRFHHLDPGGGRSRSRERCCRTIILGKRNRAGRRRRREARAGGGPKFGPAAREGGLNLVGRIDRAVDAGSDHPSDGGAAEREQGGKQAKAHQGAAQGEALAAAETG